MQSWPEAKSKWERGFFGVMLQTYRQGSIPLKFKKCVFSEEISGYCIGKALTYVDVIWRYVQFDSMVPTDSKCNCDLFPNDGTDISNGCMSLLRAVYSPRWTDKETTGRWNNLLLLRTWARFNASLLNLRAVTCLGHHLTFCSQWKAKENVQNQVM